MQGSIEKKIVLGGKVYANCRMATGIEFILCEPQKQIWFAYARVAYEYN